MKIVPKTGPSIPFVDKPSPANTSARERAVALLTGTAPTQETPTITETSQPTQQTSEQNHTNMESAPVSTEPTQAAQEATQPPREVEQPLSSQYAQLARKEKALRAQYKEMKAKEDALRAQEEAFKAREAEYQSNYVPKDRLREDTLGVLNENGVTYDAITQQALNAPSPETQNLLNEIKLLKNELKGLKGETESVKKTYEDNQAAAYQQALGQIRMEATRLIQDDSRYETVKATNSVDSVVKLIERTFKEDGVLLTVEEAAQEVEDAWTDRAVKLAKLNKIQQKLSPPRPAQAPTQQTQAKQPQTKTLTNAVTASKPLTARERAIRAFQENAMKQKS